MNRIKTSDILDPTIQQPFTGKSLFFLQDANKEMSNAISKSIIQTSGYDIAATIPYIITTEASDLYVFYVDELYKMSATASGNNIAVLTVTDDPTADPVTFTDGTPRNVHNIRTLVPTTGTLGTGLFDLVDLIDIKQDNNFDKRDNTSTLITVTPPSYTDILNFTTPNDGNSRRYMITAKVRIVFNTSGALDGGVIRIYNSSTSTQLDTTEANIHITGQTTDQFTSTLYCQYIGVLAPNTTIKLQGASTSGGNIYFALKSLIGVEIK
jgi:hypothetical protein